MITAILVYEHPQASSLVEALQPDNTPEIRMKPIGKKVLVVVRADNLRTVVASCDDLFANLQIAQEILCDSEESTGFLKLSARRPRPTPCRVHETATDE